MPATTQQQPEPARPTLPKQFTHTTPAPVLQYQGAEALVYRTTFLFPDSPPQDTSSEQDTSPTSPFQGTPIAAALKYRPSKPYRHPVLDAKLTRARILSEARVLAKLKREGVNVPGVLAVDWPAPGDITSTDGWMLMEWVEGETVRSLLDRELSDSAAGTADEQRLMRLMGRVGRLVGRVHELGVVHGDLTTSNLMVRGTAASVRAQESIALDASGRHEGEPEEDDVVLVDFGLAFQSSQEEDRAVDLYVLERAFGSSHPRTERLFGEILRVYGESLKGGKVVLKRLDEVRMRGRKKIMIG